MKTHFGRLYNYMIGFIIYKCALYFLDRSGAKIRKKFR